MSGRGLWTAAAGHAFAGVGIATWSAFTMVIQPTAEERYPTLGAADLPIYKRHRPSSTGAVGPTAGLHDRGIGP